MGIPLSALMIEDIEDDALLIMRELERGGYDVAFKRVDTAQAMLDALATGSWDIVIADYAMPRFDGLSALSLLRESGYDLPFVIVSGTIGEELAVAAMKAGAHDYVMKHNLARLIPVVERELQEAETRLARKRAEQLLLILNQASLVIEQALTPEEIFAAIAKSLGRIGFSCIVLPLDDSQRRLHTKYVSLESVSVTVPEDLAGLKHGDFSFAVQDVDVYRQAVLDRRTVLIENTEEVMRQVLPQSVEELAHDLIELVDYRTAIIAPLIVGDQVIGVLSVQSVDLTLDDIPTITAFANQVAAAWHRAQLFEQAQQEIAERKRAESALRQRSAQLEALQQVGLELTAQLDLSTLLQSIVTRAIELLGGVSGGFYLYRPEQGGLEWVLGIGSNLPPVGSTLEPGAGVCGRVWEDGNPLIVNDYWRWEGRAAVFDGLANVASVAALVRWGDESLGVLNVLAEVPHTFTRADAELLGLFATQAAIAIRNARLYESASSRADRLAVVNHIARAVGATLHLDDLLETVYHEVTTIFEPDAFFIALYDEDVEELDFRIQVDHGVRQPPERQPVSRGLTSLIVSEKQPLLIRDFEREKERLPVPEIWGTMEVAASWLGVPMQVSDRLVGAMSIQSYQAHAYSSEDQQLLSTIADQVAIAVERARLYHTLRERRRYLEGVLAAAPDAIVTLDADGRIVEWNSGAEGLFGYSAGEAIGQDLDRLICRPAMHDEASALTQKVMQGQTVSPQEAVRFRKDGTPVDVILAGSPIEYEEKLIGVVSIYTDISERKRAERFLYALNDVALAVGQAITPEAIFTTAGEELKKLGLVCAIMITDDDRSHLYPEFFSYQPKAVDASEKLLGIKAEEMALRVDQIDAFKEVIMEGRTVLVDGEKEIRQVLPGPLRPLAGKVVKLLNVRRSINAPLFVEDEIVGLLSVQSDDLTWDDVPTVTVFAHQIATAWRKAQLMQDLENSLGELRQTQSQLFQAQKMEALGRFAGGIAHDFNNLLTVIDISTRLLERQLHRQDPLWEHVQRIQETGERAAKLTKQLLSFSRREIIEPRVMDLNGLIRDLGGMLRRIIGEDVGLVTQLSRGLWKVKVDPSQMEQVVVNLVVNARDAMPEGGVLAIATENVVLDDVYVAHNVDAQIGPHVLLTVSDSGVGMSDLVKLHLFEPFFTTKERGQGTGLGLPIVFGIVKQSGGHIGVYSEEGQGTTFKIYLPCTSEDDAQSSPDDVPAATVGGTETILVVEDESSVRDLAASILESHGYQVLVASNGVHALSLGERHASPIHLLLTDVVMPKMNGRELAERLQARWSDMRVLYMSGYSSDVVAHHGVLDEGVAVLTKPFTLDSLTRKVRIILDAPTRQSQKEPGDP